MSLSRMTNMNLSVWTHLQREVCHVQRAWTQTKPTLWKECSRFYNKLSNSMGNKIITQWNCITTVYITLKNSNTLLVNSIIIGIETVHPLRRKHVFSKPACLLLFLSFTEHQHFIYTTYSYISKNQALWKKTSTINNTHSVGFENT